MDFQQPRVGVSYKCPHCDKESEQISNAVLLCDCVEAQQNERLERERQRQFRRDRQSDWKKIREERKIRRTT